MPRMQQKLAGLGETTRVNTLLRTVLLAVGLSLTTACPPLLELMMQAEVCVQPLAMHTNATLRGKLSEADWRKSCGEYETSLKCIKDLLEGCREEETNIAETVVQALKHGMGQLCDKEATFRRYLTHADCYRQNEHSSMKCIDSFNGEIHNITQSAHEGGAGDGSERMCKSFDNLVNCVDGVITSNCGKDAFKLFDDLLKTIIPSHVTSDCKTETTEKPYKSESNSGKNSSTNLQKTTSMSIASVLSVFAFMVYLVRA